MKKTLSTFILFFASQFSLFSQDNKSEQEKQDYVVTLNNDTIYGSIGTWGTSHTSWGGYAYRIKTKDGNKTKYNVDNAKIVFYNGRICEAKPKKPNKGSDSKKDFMYIYIKNSKYTLYCYAVPCANGDCIEYFLFEGDKFIDEVKRSNHKELILKYFGDCDGIVEAFKTKNNWYGKLGELSNIYSNYKCK